MNAPLKIVRTNLKDLMTVLLKELRVTNVVQDAGHRGLSAGTIRKAYRAVGGEVQFSYTIQKQNRVWSATRCTL